MSLAIMQTKELLRKQIDKKDYFDNSLNYQTFSRLYIGTNENIKAILEKTDISDVHKALCVLASGDQAFNLVSLGVHDIETFDINGLTEYYVFGIKMALIEKYNYHEYLQVIKKLFDYTTTLEELTDIINDLLPYMDKKYRNFWQNISSYNYKNQVNNEKHLNLFHLISYHFPESLILPNHYLESEINYNNFKTNLKHTKISYKRLNIIKSTRGLDKYDLIYLSNVMDYACISRGYDWTNTYFEEFLGKLHNHTTNHGKIALTSLNSNQPYVWNGSNLKAEKIINAEIHEIPNIFGEEYDKELLVLSRKKSPENID